MKRSTDRIRIKGFKSIREADIALNPLNVLIGPNGAGKSNFIGLFKLINNIIERNLQVFVGVAGGANNILHFGRKETPSITVKLAFTEASNGYDFQLIGTDEDSLIFESETAWFHYKTRYFRPHTVERGGGHLETRLINRVGRTSSEVEEHVVGTIKSWKVYHFHDTSAEARVKQACELADNRYFKSNASNLASFLYLLRDQHPTNYKKIENAVRLIAPFFQEFILEPLALNQDMIRLEWKEKGYNHTFGPNALSDGTLRFICLATLLLQPNLPSTILLDEPELGLHPYAITLLAELLRSASTKTQLIVSTQSTSLVNQFEPQDILVVEREAGQSVFKRLDQEPMDLWLEDYGLGDLWEKNLLGGRP